MFQSLLVPLDGSSESEAALPIACTLAEATGGSAAIHVGNLTEFVGSTLRATRCRIVAAARGFVHTADSWLVAPAFDSGR